ncbi:Ras-related protein Rab-23 [Phytophthora cinnamomi]|uniref:Ras-related protein Rab-23 n=1 Tax=Phytophthora cinnamomi TaxID=4785 RepID=UPI00355990A8|nr:Ras-related protein Rab-23 [Phytophthora cinnamomi]
MRTLKVIVVGNGNVGKTSMTTRYAKGKYTGTYKKTIGVDFMEKTVELRDLGETINLMIWDTAGQEEFDTLTSRYYKGAGAVIYVFSTVDRASFDDLPKWRRKVEEECGQICSVLVQNKIDLEEDAAMTRDEVEDMADHLNMRLYRACVQDNVNVGEVFRYLCRRFLKSGDDGDEMVHAVTDISTLSQTVKATEMSRHTSSPEPRAKREISDISDIESDLIAETKQNAILREGTVKMITTLAMYASKSNAAALQGELRTRKSETSREKPRNLRAVLRLDANTNLKTRGMTTTMKKA